MDFNTFGKAKRLKAEEQKLPEGRTSYLVLYNFGDQRSECETVANAEHGRWVDVSYKGTNLRSYTAITIGAIHQDAIDKMKLKHGSNGEIQEKGWHISQ